MRNKAEKIPIKAFNGLGTDAAVSRTTPFIQNWLVMAAEERKQQAKGPVFPVMDIADILIGQSNVGFPWGISSEGYWSNRIVPQPRRSEAAYVCNECVKLYEPRELIEVRSIIGSEHCISSEKGQKLIKVIKDILSKRGKINLSFAGVNDISSAFLDEAIGNLYNGDFQEEDLKGINYKNISKEDLFLLANVIEWAKEDFREQGLSAACETE